MWHRYGTPTARAGSGTVEEFQLAKERYENDPDNVKIMFYFKDGPVSPSKLDPHQLIQINEFRKSLGEEGALYWGFNSLEEFERLLRLHITRRVQEYSSDLNCRKDKSQGNQVDEEFISSKGNKRDYEGFSDLVRTIIENVEESWQFLNNIHEITKEYKQASNVCFEELKVLCDINDVEVDKRAVDRVFDNFFRQMHQYVVIMEENVPLFGASLYAGIDSMAEAAKYYLELNPVEINEDRTRTLVSAMGHLRFVLDSLEADTYKLSSFTKGLPNFPVIKDYYNNKTMHSAANIQELMLDKIRANRILLVEAEHVMRNLLKDIGN
jgi:hypothetical protein